MLLGSLLVASKSILWHLIFDLPYSNTYSLGPSFPSLTTSSPIPHSGLIPFCLFYLGHIIFLSTNLIPLIHFLFLYYNIYFSLLFSLPPLFSVYYISYFSLSIFFLLLTSCHHAIFSSCFLLTSLYTYILLILSLFYFLHLNLLLNLIFPLFLHTFLSICYVFCHFSLFLISPLLSILLPF